MIEGQLIEVVKVSFGLNERIGRRGVEPRALRPHNEPRDWGALPGLWAEGRL